MFPSVRCLETCPRAYPVPVWRKPKTSLIKLGCLVQIINLDRDVNDPRHVFFLFKIQRRSDVGGRDRAREIPVHSFEHLVGSNKQLIGHSEAEHPGGRGVDDQFEFRRLHYRQIRRLRTLEDAAGTDADLTLRIRQAGSVAHQPASFGHFTHRIMSPLNAGYAAEPGKGQGRRSYPALRRTEVIKFSYCRVS